MANATGGDKMRVLVVGGGGREHCLVWKLAQSPRVAKVFAAPGNAGIADLAECVDISASEVRRLLDFAVKNAVDLTVVGPELPLTLGI
ncbi:MAG: purD, partial [candidate division NC10 bacterium]|nr:purD [candidate division NC10 bacterium]